MKKIIRLVVFLFVTYSYSQIISDVDITPKPYQMEMLYGDNVKTPIKKIIHIRKIDQERGIFNDTISISEYDQLGRKKMYISFENNKRNYCAEYSYLGKERKTWKNTEFTRKSTGVFFSNTFFNKHGKIKKIYNYTLTKKDTSYRRKAIYEYDKNDQLIKKSDYAENDILKCNEYFYENNKLIEFHSNTSKDKKNYLKTIYRYNSKGLLSEQRLYQIRDKQTDSLTYNIYQYNNNNLIQERYNTMDHSEKEIVVDYKYSDSNLKGIIIKQGNDSIEASYFYDNLKRFQKRILNSNTKKNFKEFFINIPYQILNNQSYIIEEESKYDQKGNLIENIKKYNDNIKKVFIYEIEYYK